MRFLLATTIVLFSICNTSAQTTIKFCVDVEKDGKCKTPTSEFAISKDGGTISFMLSSQKGFGTTGITYKFYKLEDNGQESYAYAIDQKVDTNWTVAWNEAVFYDPGTYKIKVFDSANQGAFICSNIIKIFRQ